MFPLGFSEDGFGHGFFAAIHKEILSRLCPIMWCVGSSKLRTLTLTVSVAPMRFYLQAIVVVGIQRSSDHGAVLRDGTLDRRWQ